MLNNKFNDLQVALPSVSEDALKIVKGGWSAGYIETITVIGTPIGGGYDPWSDPFWWGGGWDDYGYDPYDDGGGSGGGGGGSDPAPPADDAPTASTQDAVDLANGDATQADMDQLTNKMSDAATVLGLTASAQGLKTDALADIVQRTTGATATDVRGLTVAGKAYGIVGVAFGAVDVYYGFSDGNISNSDILNAVGLGFGVASLVASGPIGLAFGAVSLGIAIYSATSGGGSSSGGSGGGGGFDSGDYGY